MKTIFILVAHDVEKDEWESLKEADSIEPLLEGLDRVRIRVARYEKIGRKLPYDEFGIIETGTDDIDDVLTRFNKQHHEEQRGSSTLH